MNEWLCRGHHKLNSAELHSTLHRLFSSGDIEAFYSEESGFKPTEALLRAALAKSDTALYCGVSAQGGARWEKQAQPNWERYFEDCGWDEETVEITAGSHDRLIELVKNSKTLWRVRMFLDHERIERLVPWDALPWKCLTEGFRAQVRYKEMPYLPKSREAVNLEFRNRRPEYVALRNWATSICGYDYV